MTRIHTIAEVRMDVPHELRAAVAAFYESVLGLSRWAKSPPGGMGFGPTRRGLYLRYQHLPVQPESRPPLVLSVASLEAFESHLQRCGTPFARMVGFFWSDRCLRLSDPVGHRIEVRAVSPL